MSPAPSRANWSLIAECSTTDQASRITRCAWMTATAPRVPPVRAWEPSARSLRTAIFIHGLDKAPRCWRASRRRPGCLSGRRQSGVAGAETGAGCVRRRVGRQRYRTDTVPIYWQMAWVTDPRRPGLPGCSRDAPQASRFPSRGIDGRRTRRAAADARRCGRHCRTRPRARNCSVRRARQHLRTLFAVDEPPRRMVSINGTAGLEAAPYSGVYVSLVPWCHVVYAFRRHRHALEFVRLSRLERARSGYHCRRGLSRL